MDSVRWGDQTPDGSVFSPPLREASPLTHPDRRPKQFYQCGMCSVTLVQLQCPFSELFDLDGSWLCGLEICGAEVSARCLQNKERKFNYALYDEIQMQSRASRNSDSLKLHAEEVPFPLLGRSHATGEPLAPGSAPVWLHVSDKWNTVWIVPTPPPSPAFFGLFYIGSYLRCVPL